MNQNIFSEKALASLIRMGDSQKFGIDLKADKEQIIASASQAALGGSIDLSKFSKTQIQGKACVYYDDYQTALLLRAISKHIRNRLRISVPDRDRIIRGVVETLLDGTPMYATRRDITSFYETVPIAEIRERLVYDTASSERVRSYIKNFFEVHCPNGKAHGIPRGVGFSSLLAELAMRDFDQTIRNIPGVFKYYRFADDILVFSVHPSNEVDKALAEHLPKPMTFNTNKSFERYYPGKKNPNTEKKLLQYLGYKFDTKQLSQKQDSRYVRVAISDNKIKRIKSRIILSFLDYAKSNDDSMLLDRMAFLSSNYKIRRLGAEFIRQSPNVFSGIYFNYRRCGEYYYKSGKMHCLAYDARELKALDGFYHSLLRKRVAGKVSKKRLADLSKHSFNKGYALRIRVRIDPLRINLIKRAWRNV